MKKNKLVKNILKSSFQGKLYKLCILLFFASTFSAWAQTQMTTKKDASSREKISIDANWRFAFGNPLSTDKDFSRQK